MPATPINTSVLLTVTEFGDIQGTIHNAANASAYTYSLQSQPTLGSVGLDAGTGSFVYTPSSYAVGTDQFTINFTDAFGQSAVATIQIARESGIAERPSNTSCLAPERPPSGSPVQAVNVFAGIGQWDLISIYQEPSNPGIWYGIVKQGQIIRFEDSDDVTDYTTILDISARVLSESESGLIGMVFHPDFATNGRLFIYWVGLGSPAITYLTEYTSQDGGLTLDPASERELFSLNHTTTRHKGGHMEFGSDGFLYLSIGDGGPMDQAQDVSNIFGSMLRLDVDNGDPYGIPADNPFASGGGAPEIYAWGFRNPWRWSFDRNTGDLWLGDVGRVSWEEVDIVEKGGNYGWPIREGAHCQFEPCDSNGLIDPVFEYPHGAGATSVIGGFVYDGNLLPDLRGRYVFADIGRLVQALESQPDGSYQATTLVDSGLSDRGVWSLSRDLDGEVYVVKPDGIFRLEPEDPNPPASTFPETLSATGCFDSTDLTLPAEGNIPYDINVAFWSNGAEKQRFFAIPDDTTVSVEADGNWVFPIGSVLSKVFYFDDVPKETRLLVRHADGGWEGYAYQWRDDGSDADLLDGAQSLIDQGIDHIIPSRVQCIQCHVAAAGSSLGPENVQMNRFVTYPDGGDSVNQIATLQNIGILDSTASADPADIERFPDINDASVDIVDRAKTYLHANCANCHRPGGPGRGPMDFRYEVAHADMGACNIAATVDDFGNPEIRIVVPGDPALSAVNIRTSRLDLGAMPPLGKQVIDDDGVALLDQYVTSLAECP